MKKLWILLLMLPMFLMGANDYKICSYQREYCTDRPYEPNSELQSCRDGHPIDYVNIQIIPSYVYIDPIHDKFYITLFGELIEIEIKECQFCDRGHKFR